MFSVEDKIKAKRSGLTAKIISVNNSAGTYSYEYENPPTKNFNGTHEHNFDDIHLNWDVVSSSRLSSKDNSKINSSLASCTHDWTLYEGAIESYEFCIHCDKKRSIKK